MVTTLVGLLALLFALLAAPSLEPATTGGLPASPAGS